MKVTNSTRYTLTAFGWHLGAGYGDDVPIGSGKTREVLGPCLGEMDGSECHIIIPGEIVCQEEPDDNNGFQVGLGNQLNLGAGEVGITVRHYTEPRIIKPAVA